MVDNLTPEQRSERMRRIRGKNTKPEIAVRKLLFSLGYRYRIHASSLPGKPDLCFPGRRKAIFVHGCFWHGHGCKISNEPKTRTAYWQARFSKNKERDRANLLALHQLGWETLVVWECEVRHLDRLAEQLVAFLGPRRMV